MTLEAAEGRADRRIAWALFAIAFLALLVTQRSVGFVRDESVYFAAAEGYAAWYQRLLAQPSVALSDQTIVAHWDNNHEHPALMKTLFGWSFLVFHRGLGIASPSLAFRLPAFAMAALIPVLVFLLGRKLYGRSAGIFAAASFLLVPRQFFHGHLACFDIPVATMWLFTVWAFIRAQETARGWLLCGVAFGLAAATKHNALFIPLLLSPFALYRAFQLTRAEPEQRRLFQWYVGTLAAGALLLSFLFTLLGPEQFQAGFLALSPHVAIAALAIGAGGWVLYRLRPLNEGAFRALACITAMAVFGPLLFVATWPYLWHHPVDRTAWYLAFHATHNHYTWFYLGRLLRGPPFPLEYVVAVTALTVPISIFVPMTLGFFSVCARAGANLSSRLSAIVPKASWSEMLVLANAVASIAIISHPQVPHFGGVKHWFPSMPFLSILAGLSAARAAKLMHELLLRRLPQLQGRATAVTGAAFALLLAPAAWATASVHPYGTSAYSEVAGGLPGAASLGMQRQFWSNNVTGVLPWINEHARRGERLYLHEVNGYSFRDYQRNGMLRPDIVAAGGPNDATMAAYQYHQEFREQEFNIWEAFGTAKPVAGLYVDETPQVVVYRRP